MAESAASRGGGNDTTATGDGSTSTCTRRAAGGARDKKIITAKPIVGEGTGACPIQLDGDDDSSTASDAVEREDGGVDDNGSCSGVARASVAHQRQQQRVDEATAAAAASHGDDTAAMDEADASTAATRNAQSNSLTNKKTAEVPSSTDDEAPAGCSAPKTTTESGSAAVDAKTAAAEGAAKAPKACWKCSVALEAEQDVVDDVDQGGQQQRQLPFCMYECHSHPYLSVAICSVCADEVVGGTAVDTATTDDGNNDENDNDACYGCGEDDRGTLFCCDNDNGACRTGQYCSECVAKAHGGGFIGRAAVDRLLRDDGGGEGEEEWFCLECRPPTPLREMQKLLVVDDDDSNRSCCDSRGQENSARSLEEVMAEFQAVESAKRECIAELDGEDEYRQQLLREEQQSAADSGDSSELEAAVEEEIERWKGALLKHQALLADKVTHLQDELELEHKVNVSAAYRYLLDIEKEENPDRPSPHVNNSKKEKSRPPHNARGSDGDNGLDSSDDDDESVPDYVTEADKALAKRDKRQKKLQQREAATKSPLMMQMDDAYVDVEELEDSSSGDEDEESRTAFRSTWRTQVARAHPRDVQLALEHEDHQLQDSGRELTVRVIHEREDRMINFREEQQCCFAGGGRRAKGNHARKDAYTLVARRQNKDDARKANPIGRTKRIGASAKTATQTKNDAVPRPISLSPSSQSAFALPNGSHEDESPTMLPAALVRNKNGSRDNSFTNDLFDDSPLILCDEKHPAPVDSSMTNNIHQRKVIRTVSVATKLAQKLKPHQVEGVRFIWRNCFSDLQFHEEGKEEEVGGCVLAHSMGLGKSFTTIAVLHTVMKHWSLMASATNMPLLRCVLLVVPINTLTNWRNEVSNWTGDTGPLKTINLGNVSKVAYGNEIRHWKEGGGLLLVGANLLNILAKDPHVRSLFGHCCSAWPVASPSRLQRRFLFFSIHFSFPSILSPSLPYRRTTTEKQLLEMLNSASILVVDEAHTVLKNSTNKAFKTLQKIKTPRRILLTGTPLQNNVSEYYRMVEFAKPGVVGVNSEAEFERLYRVPIEKGLPSNASQDRVYASLVKQNELKQLLDPIINRKDASELRKELPPLSQVVLHVRPTRLQARLYTAFKKLQKGVDGHNYRNFFRAYTSLRPIHNHPGCLAMNSGKTSPRASPSLEMEDDDDVQVVKFRQPDWWRNVLKKGELDKLDDAENSSKIVLLLHILAYSEHIGDKVLVFSQCLKTLDFVEKMLRLDWKTQVCNKKTNDVEFVFRSNAFAYSCCSPPKGVVSFQLFPRQKARRLEEASRIRQD